MNRHQQDSAASVSSSSLASHPPSRPIRERGVAENLTNGDADADHRRVYLSEDGGREHPWRRTSSSSPPSYSDHRTRPPRSRRESPRSSSRFVWFSDFHYDPHYGTPLASPLNGGDGDGGVDPCAAKTAPSTGRAGCNSSKGLVQSALDAAVTAVSSGSESDPPAFVLVTGDSCRNHMDKLFEPHSAQHAAGVRSVAETLQELFGYVQEAFPHSEIIMSFGNNDVFPDYFLDVSGGDDGGADAADSMLKAVYDALSIPAKGSTSNRTLLGAKDESTFLQGGFYSRTIRTIPQSLVVLSLNSILFSSKLQPDLPPSAAADQFAWMERQLAKARRTGAKVYVVGHIPPAVDSYRHLQLWKDEYVRRYYNIVTAYDDVVVAQLFGHTHMDEFRVGALDEGDGIVGPARSPILLGPSVAPTYNNDPAFRVVTFNNDGGGGAEPIDYDAHHLTYDDDPNDPSWDRLYTFSEAYDGATDGRAGTEGLTSETYRALVRAMEDVVMDGDGGTIESPAFRTFISLYRSGDGGFDAEHCDGACRDGWMCAIRSATTKRYDQCKAERSRARRGREGRGGDQAVTASILAVVIAAAMAVAVLRCRHIRSKRVRYASPPSVREERTAGDSGGDEVEVPDIMETADEGVAGAALIPAFNDVDEDSVWSPYDKDDPEGPVRGSMA